MKIFFSIFFTCYTLLVFSQTKTTYIYAIKEIDTLKLDVYSSDSIQQIGKKLPVLLWMHGGGFSSGTRDSKYETELCQFAAQNGFIGISISYRLLRKGTKTGFGCDCPKEIKQEILKQATIDYLDAAAFIVDNAEKLNIDPNYLIAGGSSAGAEGVANAVFMRNYFISDIQHYENVKFAGLFSCAGAIINAEYINKDNAIPSVFFHGTDDKLVPFGKASHHYCSSEKPGYLILEGSNEIVKKLELYETPYYFNIVKGGGHELAGIPFGDLKEVFKFFNQTIVEEKIIQTVIIQTKTAEAKTVEAK
jgi:predicted esterase